MSARDLFVIFGATGDLTRRKLLPAFHALQQRIDSEEQAVVLGVGRRPMTDLDFRGLATKSLEEAGVRTDLVNRWCTNDFLHYQQSDGDMGALAARIEEIEKAQNLTGNRVFYLALPPEAFEPTLAGLRAANLAHGPGWTRLVIEKPFGRDLESGLALNRAVHEVFDESQVYRIDHYLGKETVQNLLIFRFANALFEGAWGRDGIEEVQITVAENVGVEGRAGYYDTAGAVRDMLQSHLTQLLALIAMEPPVRFEADDIRDEKVKVLKAIGPLVPERAVLGQYTTGRLDGRQVPGYRQEEGVAVDSTTPTSVAVRVEIDNWRWKGVPFLLRTGKRYSRRLTQIVITFREPAISLFGPHREGHLGGNQLIITLQPDEGFELLFDVKAPGEGMELSNLPFSFRYSDAFGEIPDAYETLIADVLEGDQTLFVRADEVEEAWRIYEPLLTPNLPVDNYPAGAWGPKTADELTQHHAWRSAEGGLTGA